MYKFPIIRYRRFADVPLDALEKLKFSVTLYDFDWRFLFINRFARQELNRSSEELMHKCLWTEFPSLLDVPAFRQLKSGCEAGSVVRVETLFPLTAKRVSVTTCKLDDYYYLAVSVLPDKEQLIDELRSEVRRKSQEKFRQ